MEIDRWVGPYRVRAFPWIEKNLIYFNVRCYAPGQSLEKPPVLDQTVYINDERITFVFSVSLTQLQWTVRSYYGSGLGQFTRNYTQTTKRGLLTTNKG